MEPAPAPVKKAGLLPHNMPWRVIAFGFLMTLSSAMGQTHFLSLFTPQLRSEFELSHSGIGSLYSLATLCSAVLLAWLGRLIDKHDVRYYTAAVITGLAAACVFLTLAETAWTLFGAFFLLRLFGQGLSSHTAIAVTSRLANVHRGKSLSLVLTGFATGEAIAPLAIAALLTVLAWRHVWWIIAAIEIVVVMAIAMKLLSKLNHHPPLTNKERGDLPDFNLSWDRGQVLSDVRFWKIAPTLFLLPFLLTSLLFHQASLAEWKGFEFLTWATGFIALPIVAAAVNVFAGHLTDTRGCQFPLRLSPPFIIIGLMVPLLPSFPAQPYVYYGILGIGLGFWEASFSALWSEVYGRAHIGANLAMANALAVVTSAASPVLFGLMLDAHFSWPVILALAIAYVACSWGALLSTKLETKAPPKRRLKATAARIR